MSLETTGISYGTIRAKNETAEDFRSGNLKRQQHQQDFNEEKRQLTSAKRQLENEKREFQLQKEQSEQEFLNQNRELESEKGRIAVNKCNLGKKVIQIGKDKLEDGKQKLQQEKSELEEEKRKLEEEKQELTTNQRALQKKSLDLKRERSQFNLEKRNNGQLEKAKRRATAALLEAETSSIPNKPKKFERFLNTFTKEMRQGTASSASSLSKRRVTKKK